MQYLQAGALAALGLASLLIQFRRDERLSKLVHLLFLLATGLVCIEEIEHSAAIILPLYAVASLNFLVAVWLPEIFGRPYLRLILPLISAVALIFLARDTIVTIGEESTLVMNKFLVPALLTASVLYDLLALKLRLLNKFFGGSSEVTFGRVFLLLGAAIVLYLSLFAASFAGAYLAGATYLIASFYRHDDTDYIGVSIVNVALAGIIALKGFQPDIYALNPDIVFALFFGVYALWFLEQADTSTTKRSRKWAFAYLIPLLLTAGIWYLGGVFGPLGGFDAVAAVLFGIALANGILGRKVLSIGISSLIIALTLLLPEGRIQNGSVSPESTVSVEKDPDRMKYIPLDSLQRGLYELVSDSSLVSFEVGKHRETKGRFKKVSGSFDFGTDLSDTEFEIILKLSDFTTFNAFRDEELMGTDYFNADKFPDMTFKGRKLLEHRPMHYELYGDFMMLGVRKEQKVQLQRVVSTSGMRLTGSGELDRTAFGMTPNAMEGNIVYFTFDVLLNRKDQK